MAPSETRLRVADGVFVCEDLNYDGNHPFARGYVTSLARPSGNITGIVFQQIELAAKRIQLIKDGFPDRLAATMFWDKLSADQWEAARSTAVKLACSFLGLNCAGRLMTMKPHSIKHRSIIAVCS
jgi:hypothetical protein